MNWRDDRGQIAGVEAVPFGVLLFVAGSLLVANLWAVVDTTMATTAAAREASRAYVEAADEESAIDAANRAAADAITGHGRSWERAELRRSIAGFRRCQPVTIEVRYEIPAVRIPMLGGIGARTVIGRHTEVIDPFRDAVGPIDGPDDGGGCG